MLSLQLTILRAFVANSEPELGCDRHTGLGNLAELDQTVPSSFHCTFCFVLPLRYWVKPTFSTLRVVITDNTCLLGFQPG